MDRLTEKSKDGRNILRKGISDIFHVGFGRFFAGEAVDRLADYEDLEEQGKLLKLPCAVGDRIYVIDTDERLSNKEIKVYCVDNIVIASDGTILLKHDVHDGVICELENIVTDKPYLDFYRCFLTREEAEAVLKELER